MRIRILLTAFLVFQHAGFAEESGGVSQNESAGDAIVVAGPSPATPAFEERPFPRAMGVIGTSMIGAGLVPMIVVPSLFGITCGLSDDPPRKTCKNVETVVVASAVAMGVGAALLLTDFTLWRMESREAKVASMEERDRPVKYASTAYLWTVGATAIPFALGLTLPEEPIEALIIGGLVVGPSAGQFYAGSPGSGLIGIGIRTVALTMASTSMNEGVVLLVAVGGAGYSLVDTWFAVRRANRRAVELRSLSAGPRTSLAPALFPVGDGRFLPGLAARVSF